MCGSELSICPNWGLLVAVYMSDRLQRDMENSYQTLDLAFSWIFAIFEHTVLLRCGQGHW